ncbi:MAG: tRNA (guanosine(46)-N7)-methyltransferase TrmB [Spirochaetaceae bacterium]|nr:tRNA (guanosine(46)-N7)-methyltransferase TrmB [Spirochaetaceae bacterium]
MQNEEQKSHIKSFVRRGYTTQGQRKALSSLNKYLINYQEGFICYNNYFKASRIIAEVGFGNGAATLALAKANPANLYLGLEVYPAGVGHLLMKIDEEKIDNLYLINHDAVPVFNNMLPLNSLDGVHIFFPDPWPKKRHHKRRLLQPAFVNILARHLKQDGYLYVVTDWQDYAEHILTTLTNEPLLINKYSGYSPPQEWRSVTKFEQKGLAKGHNIYELLFVKN